MEETVYRMCGEVIEEIEISTGRIVARSASIENLAESNLLPITTKKRNLWVYHKAYGDVITDMILAGKTLKDIDATTGLPSFGVISRWRIENEDFDKAIEAAQRMAAERFRDDIVESIDEEITIGKDFVPAAKLAFDKRKWLAEKGNPGKYGSNKDGSSGDVNIQINVDTGINRDPIVIETEVSDGSK